MADDTTTTEPSEATADGDAGEPTADRRPRRWGVLPWLVAAVAVLVAMATTSAWLSLRSEAETREDVQRAAEEFVVALTTWDASDGLDDTREELRAAGTGAFLDEVDELFGGTLGDELEQVEAVSTGEVQDVFVQRIRDGEAIALAVVLQEVRTNLSDEADVTVRSARLTMVEEDDRWLVSEVQLLNDTDPGEPEQAVPSEAVTPAPDDAAEEPSP